MSRFRKVIDQGADLARKDETVVNFMQGESYRIGPLDTLKMVTASSIFGEPSYYRAGGLGERSESGLEAERRHFLPVASHGVARASVSSGGVVGAGAAGGGKGFGDGGIMACTKGRPGDHTAHGRARLPKGQLPGDCPYKTCALLEGYLLLGEDWDGRTTTQVMEQAVDAALAADFEGTLKWAVTLRKTFAMRLNPQVIMVRAALHPGRKDFTREHPGVFGETQQQVMSRGDDALSQLAYFLYLNKGKKQMPSILKRSIARRLEALDAYEAAKYKNAEMGLKDAVRITHAHSAVIDTFMQTGTLTLPEEKKTWENLRSAGLGWKEIFYQIPMGHMALLRNLRGVFKERGDMAFCRDYLDRLKSGVAQGKQFPFRYYSAYQAVEKSDCAHRPLLMDGLEECMDLSMDNIPRFAGKTMCLSDNSGSAWGAFPSEYGTVQIAVIDNLSSVIAAAASEEGYVGKFGDKLKVYPVSKRGQILRQCREISRNGSQDVGASTEGGIWTFFDQAIQKKEHWDQIFIYSDQQAGHGGLYGTEAQRHIYQEQGYSCEPGRACKGRYINVFQMILEYRRRVNPKVNVFSIQTAGYDDVCIPEYAYRTCILYGWTGKELLFARQMIDLWDEMEGEGQRAPR